MNPEIASLQRQAELAFARKDAPTTLALLKRIVAISPNHAPAHALASRLAIVQRRMRIATERALLAFDYGLGGPSEWLPDIAKQLISVGEYAAAFAILNQILERQDGPPSVMFDGCRLLALIGCHQPAFSAAEIARTQLPNSAEVEYFRGNLLKFMGRMDEAAATFERSISLEPMYALSHWALAFMGRKDGAERRVDRIRALLARGSVPDADRCYLEYALYRELEMLGDYQAAWAALERGFRTKRRSLRHDPNAETELFDRIIEAFPNVPPALSTTPDSATPIFIVGMPRTGTTLLERILGNCPQIQVCGELNDLRMQYKWVADYYCSGFFDHEALARAQHIDYELLGRRYLDHVAWRLGGATHFTDKHPGNFQMIGVILKALPQAKILHLVRDPVDTCFSNLKELFVAHAYAYSYDLTELVIHHRNYVRLMAHWHAIAPGRILDVHYEDLVSDPEAQTARVMEYLGLPFTPGQSRIETNTQTVSTASSTQVREPIHRRNIGSWRRYAQHLQPLVEALSTR